MKSKHPILKYEPKPDFTKLSKYDIDKYWDLETKKIIEGVGMDVDYGYGTIKEIPGSFYMAVQHCPLKNRNTGAMERYIARDVNLLQHQKMRESGLKRVPSAFLKARGTGFSTDGIVFGMQTWKEFPGSAFLMTSKDKASTRNLYYQKMLPVLENCDKHIFNYADYKRNPKEGQESGDKVKAAISQTEIHVQLRVEVNGNINYCDLIARETSQSEKSASAFSGTGGKVFLFDEFFLHPRPSETINSVIGTLRDTSTGLLNGNIIIGGVCENTVTGEQFARLFNIWKSFQERGYITTFIPAWMGKFCDENGWSDQEKGIQWWEQEVEKLSRLNDKNELIAFKKNNPMSEQDVWDFAASSDFEPDIVEQIKHQIIIVKEHPPRTERVILYNYNGTVIKKDNNDAPFFIIEQPKEGIMYDLTMDATATGTETSQEEGSKACSLVIKRGDPEGTPYRIVGGYYERPASVEISYQNTFNLLRYYDKFGGVQKLSAEANASTAEHLSKAMIKEGLQRFILLNKGKPFFYVTTDYRATQLLRANPFLRKYISNIDYLPLLEQMVSELPMGKKDILASWLMWFFALPTNYDDAIKPKPNMIVDEVLEWNPRTMRYERRYIYAQPKEVVKRNVIRY